MRCGVYLHIPYCSRKCDYCAFHSTVRWTAADEHGLIDKMISDARLFSGRDTSDESRNGGQGFGLPRVEAKTLYIGGGTPSILGRGELARLIGGVTAALGDPEEITCEANPESAQAGFLAEAAGAGVTRLSLGVQSLSPELCSAIGRRPTQVGELEAVRSGWEGLLSADLIIGIPGQTTPELVADIRQLIRIGFSHLSVYDLSVEPGTPLARKVAAGTISIPEEEPDWQTVSETLAELGFTRYEVSNFARPGNESLHNLGYWRAEPYLGLGPSATSTLQAGDATVRFVQSTNHADYLREHPFGDAERETLDPATLMMEYLMLGLRTSEGVGFTRFRELFDVGLDASFGGRIAELVARKLLKRDESSLQPTSRGMDLLNRVLVELLSVTQTHMGDRLKQRGALPPCL